MDALFQRKLQKTIKKETKIIKNKNGSIFNGVLIDNKPNGKGRYELSDGSYYEGEFKNGDLCGKGEFYISFINLKYKGNFLKGEKHGFGILEKENYKYEGNFENGRKHGKFLEYLKDGFIQEGEYLQDRLEGKIKNYNKETGEVFFEGFIVNGKKEGKCLYKTKNFQYEGNFKNDQFELEGNLTVFPDMIEYNGNFKNNSPLSKGNIFDIKVFIKKENKKGEEEIIEIKKIGNNGLKLETCKHYIIEIKILFQGEDEKNPEYNENLKNKNKIKEFLTPEPILITEESGRKFTYFLKENFEDEKIYCIDFGKEFGQLNEEDKFELDLEKEFPQNIFLTKNGVLKIEDFILPSNFITGSYTLTFKDISQFHSEEFNCNLGEFSYEVDLIGQKKKK